MHLAIRSEKKAYNLQTWRGHMESVSDHISQINATSQFSLEFLLVSRSFHEMHAFGVKTGVDTLSWCSIFSFIYHEEEEALSLSITDIDKAGRKSYVVARIKLIAVGQLSYILVSSYCSFRIHYFDYLGWSHVVLKNMVFSRLFKVKFWFEWFFAPKTVDRFSSFSHVLIVQIGEKTRVVFRPPASRSCSVFFRYTRDQSGRVLSRFGQWNDDLPSSSASISKEL